MSNTNSESALFQRSEIFGHPKGLFILFFTEMWERFSYYGMRAILILYLVATITDGPDGGLGWSNADALVLYGWYTMLVYVMSIPGGILADKVLGAKKAVMVGGLLLCAGHGILAVDAEWAFFTGLALIVLGVGALKPNISTMVGGLYKPGDVRRDKGFTIFYIGINIGAFAASLIVAVVAKAYGWHYGFGLAGIGMLLGQLVYMWGQKFLVGIGDYIPAKKISGGVDHSAPLTPIEKDRVVVLLISFLIIIVFWGAFEQAGGLLNLYAQSKIDRDLFGWEVPAGVFQGVNSFFIITLGTAVAAYWANRALKGKESSTLLKMAVGTIIMGLGFLMMAQASVEAGPTGKASMVWLVLAYLLHTVGELCASPTALSFITKLAPVKYASIMMGVYFAATGIGNKMAGMIGEEAQSEPIAIVAEAEGLNAGALQDSLMAGKEQYVLEINAMSANAGGYQLISEVSGNDFSDKITLKNDQSKQMLMDAFATYQNSETPQLPGTITFNKREGSTATYDGTLVLNHVQNDQEFKIFVFITIFTVAFGLLLIAFLKKLKKLTHGAEDLKEVKEE